MKEKLKKQKGITLIALIITIIILLILAAVSVQIITNQGIIKYAEDAANTFDQKQDNEIAQLNSIEDELNKYSNTTTETTEWWELKPGEKEQLRFLSGVGEVVAYTKATYETTLPEIMVSITSGELGINENGITIIIMKKGILYLFCDENTELNNGRNDYSFEKGKWYVRTNDSVFNQETTMEYTGSSPIQLSEFSDDEIFCKTYLERVIGSFNN